MLRSIKYILLLVVVLSFTTCKKYPENNLWFKSPKKAFKGGHITSILVDGVDSISYINSLCGFDVSQEKFTYFYGWEGLTSEKICGSLSFSGNGQSSIPKKECGFVLKFYPNKESYTINVANPPYLPFERYSVWKILKLVNNGAFIIQLQKNGKTYEVHFN